MEPRQPRARLGAMNRSPAAMAMAFLLAACATPGPTPPPTPPASPSPAPSPSPGAEGLYLRAWLTQALPPDGTFGWLPTLTISDGLAIDGNVAIPMIFPGPLLIMPNARQISGEGQAAIVQVANDLGLLEGATDLTGDGLMPGAPTAHVLITVDGKSVEIIGDPNAFGRCAPGDLRCVPEPQTPEAFAFFWARLGHLDDWLGDELGPTVAFVPERMAVVTREPAEQDMGANFAAWPLETPFADFGEPWVLTGSRCATVTGEGLEVLLPELAAANQLTVFVDQPGEQRALLVRPLVPGEPSPCEGS